MENYTVFHNASITYLSSTLNLAKMEIILIGVLILLITFIIWSFLLRYYLKRKKKVHDKRSRRNMAASTLTVSSHHYESVDVSQPRSTVISPDSRDGMYLTVKEKVYHEEEYDSNFADDTASENSHIVMTTGCKTHQLKVDVHENGADRIPSCGKDNENSLIEVQLVERDQHYDEISNNNLFSAETLCLADVYQCDNENQPMKIPITFHNSPMNNEHENCAMIPMNVGIKDECDSDRDIVTSDHKSQSCEAHINGNLTKWPSTESLDSFTISTPSNSNFSLNTVCDTVTISSLDSIPDSYNPLDTLRVTSLYEPLASNLIFGEYSRPSLNSCKSNEYHAINEKG